MPSPSAQLTLPLQKALQSRQACNNRFRNRRATSVAAGKDPAMTIYDLLGFTFVALLLGGHLWGLVDLSAKIRKQPRKPINVLRLSPYPFVPDEKLVTSVPAGESTGGPGGLRLSPVPVETRNQALR